MKNIKKSKNIIHLILMIYIYIYFIHPLIPKEYNIFSPNNESSLEQEKQSFALLKKVNNSIATKPRVTLVQNCGIYLK